MTDSKDTQLDRLIDGLDERIAPARDLWPDIEAELEQSEHSGGGFWQWRVAASVFTMMAVLAWAVMPSISPQPVLTVEVPELAPDALRYAAFDAEFLQVREQTINDLEAQLASLSPATRGVVMGNLQIIRQSIDEINEAIDREPNNIQLRELLQLAWRQEMSVMTAVYAGAAAVEQSEIAL